MSQLSDKAIDMAIVELGVQENPIYSNWGRDVSKYLLSVGIDFPASWCAALVYWCFNQACIDLAMENPLTKTAGVLRLWNSAKPANKVTEPQAGDIFIMDFGKGLGHTGIVEKTDKDFIYTIEGNSNNNGDRNGYEVVRHGRLINNHLIKGYLRY